MLSLLVQYINLARCAYLRFISKTSQYLVLGQSFLTSSFLFTNDMVLTFLALWLGSSDPVRGGKGREKKKKEKKKKKKEKRKGKGKNKIRNKVINCDLPFSTS